jgi:hypothetical protein
MDFIPISDVIFFEWVKVFATYVNEHFAELGLTPEQNARLQSFFSEFLVDYPAHLDAKRNAAAITQRKDTSRGNLKNVVREFAALIQANPLVTDAQRAALGITIPKSRKTHTPVPSTKPIAVIDNRNRFEHIIRIYDEATPKRRAKPKGVMGCQIWLKIGGSSTAGYSEFIYHTLTTKSPHIVTFKGEDAGKMAHYNFRWVNTRNEPGPWSETVSVTISG